MPKAGPLSHSCLPVSKRRERDQVNPKTTSFVAVQEKRPRLSGKHPRIPASEGFVMPPPDVPRPGLVRSLDCA